MSTFGEHRNSVRVPTNLNIYIKTTSGIRLNATMLNISLHGCCVSCNVLTTIGIHTAVIPYIFKEDIVTTEISALVVNSFFDHTAELFKIGFKFVDLDAHVFNRIEHITKNITPSIAKEINLKSNFR